MPEAGSAAVDITPPLGSRMAGSWYHFVAEVTHDPLYARALVIDDGTTSAAIVTCDTLSIKRSTVLRARELAAARTGIPPGRILICATHTHNGPAAADLFARPADAAFVAVLPDRIADAVAAAYRARQPAEIGVGSGTEGAACHNRRFLRRDGTAQMHPPKGDPSFVGPEGPDDPEVGVLFARGADGRLVGTVVNYSSHPILVLGEKAFSADFPGWVARTLQAVKGEQGQVLFMNGAFANLSPIDVYAVNRRERGWAWVERIGNMIAGEALKTIEKTDPMPESRVRVASRQLELRVREPTDEELADARSLLTRERPPIKPVMSPEDQAAFREYNYAEEIVLLADERARAATVPAEVQVVAVGDAAFVGIPGELFVEFGLEIKQRSPFRHTYIAGMANGCVGYVPTRRAFEGGGYETRLGRHSKLEREAGEQLTAAAIALLKETHAAV